MLFKMLISLSYDRADTHTRCAQIPSLYLDWKNLRSFTSLVCTDFRTLLSQSDFDAATTEIFTAKTDQNECSSTRKSDFLVRALDEEFCVLKKFPHVVVSLEQLTGTIFLLFSISKWATCAVVWR